VNGTWDVEGPLHVGGGLAGAGGTGYLAVEGGTVKVRDTLAIWGGGGVSLEVGTLAAHRIDHSNGGKFWFWSGDLFVGELFDGSLFNIGGTLHPGLSPGILSVTGDYWQGPPEGRLVIEIGGRTPGSEHDVLQVGGLLTACGVLEVRLVGGFVPGLGNGFDILDWGTFCGGFDAFTLPPLPGDLVWNTTDLYGTGRLWVTRPGDVIPEPSTLGVLLLGSSVLLRRRRRLGRRPPARTRTKVLLE